MGSIANRIREGLDAIDFDPERIEADTVAAMLSRYLDILMDWNGRMNLVGPIDSEGAVGRHIMDSLAPIHHIERVARSGARIGDVGSGAGLPGIPLAVVLADRSVDLIERSVKKCGFLRHVVGELGLSNVTVVDRDLREVRDRYDVLTLRAVATPDRAFLDLLLRHISPGGAAALYKGRRTVVDEELSRFALKQVEVHPVRVPELDAERHLVLVGR